MRPSPCITRQEDTPSRLDAQLQSVSVPEHISRIVARFLATAHPTVTKGDDNRDYLNVVSIMECPRCRRTLALVRGIGQAADVVCTAAECSGRTLMAQTSVLGLQWPNPAQGGGALASSRETASEHIRNAMQMLPALAECHGMADSALAAAIEERLKKALAEIEQ